MPQPQPRPQPKGRLVALVGLPAAAGLMALVAQWEGKENVAYRDIVGVWTLCYGDTNSVRPGQVATDGECAERLERQLVSHAKPVLACVPALRYRPNQLIASVSLAYNIGAAGFCRSTAAKHFNAGRWKEGCLALKRFDKARVNGRLVPVRGLQRRRADEARICLTGL